MAQQAIMTGATGTKIRRPIWSRQDDETGYEEKVNEAYKNAEDNHKLAIVAEVDALFAEAQAEETPASALKRGGAIDRGSIAVLSFDGEPMEAIVLQKMGVRDPGWKSVRFKGKLLQPQVVSMGSPLGQALLGRQRGDKFTYQPAGGTTSNVAVIATNLSAG